MNYKMTTDTPRTDAASFSSRDPLELMKTSQQLERELKASKAEVERLKEKVAERDQLVRTSNRLAKEEAKILQRWKEWGFDQEEAKKKVEAEVERFREQYEAAAELVARMHAAGVGEIRGSIISVVDDIKAVRERAEKAEAEVKEIRAALGDDGRRTHKEILELAFKASGWKLWKEKYIDLKNAYTAEGQDPAGTIWDHADKLQKDLKESNADVQRIREYYSRFILVSPIEAERMEKIEAELAELKKGKE